MVPAPAITQSQSNHATWARQLPQGAREFVEIFSRRGHDIAMTIEPWADAQLSEDIPRLVQGGESETVEFKRELPKQVRDLARKSRLSLPAAGADSSWSGRRRLDSRESKMHMTQRFEMISAEGSWAFARSSIPVRPQIGWTSANGLGVLVITVEKGSEPLYYVDSRAYIRHGTVLPTGDGLRGSRCLDSFHAGRPQKDPRIIRAVCAGRRARQRATLERYGLRDAKPETLD